MPVETPFPDPVAEPPRRRRTPVWAMVLIAAAALFVPVAGLAIVVGAGALYVMTAEQVPATPADHAAILSAQDFCAAWEVDVQPELGALSKIRYADGTQGLEYEYEDDAFYLYSSIDVEHNERDARGTYAGLTLFSGIGIAVGEDDSTRFERDDGLFRWGEQSQFYRCVVDGETRGYLYAGRQGTHVLYTVWSGLVFAEGDAASIAEFLTPALERMARHEL
jgi:hypothetical protein